MQMTMPSSVKSVFAQIIGIVCATTAFTHIVEKVNYKGLVNALLLSVIILFVTVTFNEGVRRRIAIAIGLSLVCVVTIAINGALFGYID